MIPAHLLENLPLVADGSPGDWLVSQRRAMGGLPEAVNLRRPEWVQQAHDAFFQAGARVLRTNSARADAVTLAALGLDDRCEAINNSATALLRAAVGQQALVMGTLAPIPQASPVERERAHAQQLVYMADTGVDFVLLDGFGGIAEAELALRLARHAGDTPVLAVLLADAAGRLGDGMPVADALRTLADAEADAVGAVFPPGAADLRPLAEPLLALGLPLAVLLSGDEARTLAPADFSSRLAPLAGLGVAIVGGGRHIGPPHIAALAQALQRPTS